MSDVNGREQVRRAPRYWLLSLALGLVVGLLGANRFADAAGFPPKVTDTGVTFRVFSGLVVGLATLAVVQFLLRQVPLVIGVVARSPNRPSTAVSITLLICGTVCVLGTLALEWHVASAPPAVVQTIDVPGMNIRGLASVEVSTSGPLMPHLLALLVLLTGVALIALGVWGSLKPTPTMAVVGEVGAVPAAHMATGIRDNPVKPVE